jgi:hypothetical protein
MNQAKNEEEEELPIKDTPKLRLLTGGKGPPDNPIGKNWLRELPQHTVFLCQERTEKIAVQLWFIVFKFTNAILLGSNVNQEIKVIVNDEEFCKRHTLLEIIEFGGDAPLPTPKKKKSNLILPEITDGTSNRPG